jgi:hypothetical protein
VVLTFFEITENAEAVMVPNLNIKRTCDRRVSFYYSFVYVGLQSFSKS